MNHDQIFTHQWLASQFPASRTDDFFEALFGGAEDGAYDISLIFVAGTPEKLDFAFELQERPGKCLACNLTYGLPQVFSRHPVINVKNIAAAAAEAVGAVPQNITVDFGSTKELSPSTHQVPFTVTL